MRKYTPAQIQFVSKKIHGRSYEEMTRLFNKRFGLSITFGQMKALLKNHGLCNGFGHGNPTIPRKRKYLDRHVEFLKKVVPGKYYSESVKLFNDRFGFSVMENQLASLCKRLGIQTGFTGCFPKGHVPFNKGMKGHCAPGSEKGWFKKGNIPTKYRPVGSERIIFNGYVQVKIADPKKWKSKHAVIWEKANGEIPKGSVVIFADGNKRNFKLSNLLCVTRNELYQMNRLGMISPDAELTKAGKTIAAIYIQGSRLKRQSIQKSKSKKTVFLNKSGYKVFVSHGTGRNKNKWIAVRESRTGAVCELRVKQLKYRTKFEDAQKDLTEYALFLGWQRA